MPEATNRDIVWLLLYTALILVVGASIGYSVTVFVADAYHEKGLTVFKDCEKTYADDKEAIWGCTNIKQNWVIIHKLDQMIELLGGEPNILPEAKDKELPKEVSIIFTSSTRVI